MTQPIDVTDTTFETEVLNAELPVLTDFWAPWCGPCRAIGPVVEELAAEYAGRLKVSRVNIDENPHTPARYNVRGIPNLILFQDGEAVEQIVGAVPKAQLVQAIQGVLDALSQLRDADMTDAEIVETLAHGGLNIFTNYLNHVADTAIDFPFATATAHQSAA